MQQKKYLFITYFFICFALPNWLAAQKNQFITDSINTTFTQDTSIVYTIGSIELKGNKQTKNYIIFREVTFKEGNTYKPNELTNALSLTQKQLINTLMFNEVLVYVSSLRANIATVKIEVKERWYLLPLPYFKIVDRNFNQWWFDHKRDLNRVNYGIKFTHDNLSGRKDKLSIDLVNGYNQQVFIGYNQPFSDKKLKQGFSVVMFYNRQREMNYNTINNKQAFLKLPHFVRESKGINFQYTYRPDSKYRFSANIGLNDENVLDTIVKLNPNYYGNNKSAISFFSIAAGLKYNNVDYIPFPQKGLIYEFYLYNRGFSKQMNLFSFTAEATYAIKFSKANFVQFHNWLNIRAKATDQPFINQSLLGYGDVFLRGMESYVVDGTMGFLSNTTIYQKLFTYIFKNPFKIKNHEKIPFTFYIKAFGDMGYVKNTTTNANSFTNSFLYTKGVGIDVLSLYDFVFRLEYSFNQFGQSGFGIRARGDF